MPEQIIPKRVCIDGCTVCQLRCADCSMYEHLHDGTLPFGYSYLKAEDFKKFLETDNTVKAISFQNIGELFLNKDLLEILKIGAEKGIELDAPTGVNLNTASPEVLEGVVKYGLRVLQCSIDGTTQEVYSKYRRRGNLDTVLNNVRLINEFKKKYNSQHPVLGWQFVVFGHNEHQLPEARKMAEERGMIFNPKMQWDSDYSPIKDKEFVKKHTGWTATSRAEYFEQTGYNYMRRICYQLWNNPRLNWNGDMVGCCRMDRVVGGNAFEDGLLSAFNSGQINTLREALMGKTEMPKDSTCINCDIYQDLKRSGKWLTAEEIALGVPVQASEANGRRIVFLKNAIHQMESGNYKGLMAEGKPLFPQAKNQKELIEHMADFAATIGLKNDAITLLVNIFDRYGPEKAACLQIGKLLAEMGNTEQAHKFIEIGNKL